MRDVFDWDGIADNIVVPEQAAIAVYTNPKGNIVIRQAGQYGPDEDQWIVLAPSHARALAEAITREAGLDHEPMLQLTAPAPLTNAERQRRWRNDKRNERNESVTTVTPDRNAPLLMAAE
jgi:hypothetical protein